MKPVNWCLSQLLVLQLFRHQPRRKNLEMVLPSAKSKIVAVLPCAWTERAPVPGRDHRILEAHGCSGHLWVPERAPPPKSSKAATPKEPPCIVPGATSA